MKVDLSKPLYDGKGASAKDETGTIITAYSALARALVTDGKPPSAPQKIARYKLFSKIVRANVQEPVDLTIDELAVAQDAIDVWPTLLYGQLYTLLNQGT